MCSVFASVLCLREAAVCAGLDVARERELLRVRLVGKLHARIGHDGQRLAHALAVDDELDRVLPRRRPHAVDVGVGTSASAAGLA